MRSIEILFLLVLAATLIAWCLPRRRIAGRVVHTLVALVVALGLLHLAVEGGRWQLVPAYALSLLCAAAAIIGAIRGQVADPGLARRAAQITGAVAGLAVVAIAAALGTGFPVFELPIPSGPHAVGTAAIHIVDSDRRELFGPSPGGPREFMVHVWYPAQTTAGLVAATYATPDDPLSACAATVLAGLGDTQPLYFVSSHFPLTRTHSYADAAIVREPASLPVLVFSHGYAVARSRTYTALMEELASHGYAVFSIDHTYETPGVRFPDGRVVCGDVARMKTLLQFEETGDFFETWDGELTSDERLVLAREYMASQVVASESLEIWVADTAALMAKLEQIDALGAREHLFASRLDLEKVGVFGMSFGGATAGSFCFSDSRCGAGLNMDGFQFGDLSGGHIAAPFMLLSAVRETPSPNRWIYSSNLGPFYAIDIQGTTHMNFTDASIIFPMLKLGGAMGEIDGHRMLQIMNRYTLAFFDHHLRGLPAPLLAGASAAYPDVAFSSTALPDVAAPIETP